MVQMVFEKAVKLFVVVLIAYLILSLPLLLSGIIDPPVFWAVALFAAVFAFVLLPRIRK